MVEITELERKAFLAGMRYAARLVGDHWNDSQTRVVQREQAQASARMIESKASRFMQTPIEIIAILLETNS